MAFFCIETTVIVVGLHVDLSTSVRGGVTMVVPFPGIRAEYLLEWKRNREGWMVIVSRENVHQPAACQVMNAGEEEVGER